MRGFSHGAWDLHVHAGPDLVPRSLDVLEVAARCRRSGMRGLVLKSHLGSTVAVARLAEKYRPGIKVLGSVTLNGFTGGLNPAVVERELEFGARIVWLPTVHSAFHRRVLGRTPYGDYPGIRILNAKGRIKPEVKRIAKLVAEQKAVLATGHISPREVLRLHQELRDSGSRVKLLVTHAFYRIPNLGVRDLAQLVHDRTWLETAYHSVSPKTGTAPPARVAAAIKALPEAQWVMTSDSGQKENPCSPRGLEAFALTLGKYGISPRELRRMAAARPAALLRS